ncbi:hypothetical protein XENOCAPTIV_012602 [Xenoophorus captivus]|uniref:Uncharacterized protein n=1 Tax=Xenoophorus captivus TaxID=1517983 RepID=A0ABV0R026_9TELE
MMRPPTLFPQGSFGFPSVLDSSEVSTENGRTSRFPRPELEISFSPLQPNRIALKRQGEENAVTVKITRTARKRKSGEMEKVGSIQPKAAEYPGYENMMILSRFQPREPVQGCRAASAGLDVFYRIKIFTFWSLEAFLIVS